MGEFEGINGKHSMPHLIVKKKKVEGVESEGDKSVSSTPADTPATGTPATTPVSSARASPAPKDKEEEGDKVEDKPEVAEIKENGEKEEKSVAMDTDEKKESKEEEVKDEPSEDKDNKDEIKEVTIEGDIAPSQQFPPGFKGGQLPGAFGTNFAQFRPQYSIPGQAASNSSNPPQAAFPGTAPPSKD